MTQRDNAASPGETSGRLAESRQLMERLPDLLASPRVRLRFKATTPIYEVDPENPELVIRKLGRTVTRGYFKDGTFVAVP